MKILLYIIILLSVINLSVSQNFNLDSIDNLNSEDKYSAYQTIYKSVLNSDSAQCREYILKSLNLAESLKDNDLIAESYGSLAFFYDYYMNYTEAIEYYTIQIDIIEKIDTLSSKSPHNNLGVIYKDIGDYEKSLYHLEKAAKISNLLKDPEDEINSKNNIANVYSSWGKVEKAKEILRECVRLSLKDSIRKSTAFSYANLGSQFQYNQIYDSTLHYYHLASNYFDSKHEPEHIIELHSAMSNIYLEINKLDSAKYHIDQAERLLQENRNFNSFAETKLYKGKYLYKVNKLNKALETLNEALPKIEELQNINLMTKYYQLASNIHDSKGNYKASNDYLKKLLAIKDTINSRNYERSLASYEVRMNIAEKEKENQLLQTKQEKSDLQNNYLIAVIVFVLVVILIILFRYFEVAKIKKQLEEQNQKITEANRKLIESENELKELNATKDKFFSIIAHDLKNPIGTFKNLTELLHKEYDSFDDGERKEFIEMLNNSGESLNLLLENLLTWSRSQRGKINFDPVKINLRDIAQKNFDVLQLHALQKNIELINKINDDIEFDGDPNMITTIFRNITGNSIKFTPDGGSVSIDAVPNGKMIAVSITDNGVGMDNEKINKLFKIDKNISTDGTNNEKGTGLGLIIVKEFLDKHNGEIKVQSEIGKGTTFELLFPKNLDVEK